MLSPVEEIKSRLDIVEVIQGYLRLNKAGANWKGLCPFHSEKTPSFMVSQSRQMWHCFGCGQGGDVFSFVSKMEGGEFADALRILADKAGVKLSRQDPRVQSQRKKLYEICELATRFFERQMASAAGQLAAAYLEERGVNKKTIDYFRLGWAPDSWRSLRDFLRGEDYGDAEIAAAGLSIKSESGFGSGGENYHDRFRHRVMFPIADSQEQIIGFSGRIFDRVKGKTVHEDAGKYINTPNTFIYDKSRALYGLDKAKMAIRSGDGAVVVEGNLDVIMSHQAGVKNTVAACGTALTTDHFRTLKRYGEKVFLAFDADEAGEGALKKTVGLALAGGLAVFAVAIPLGKDTADAVKENPELWRDAVAHPEPYVGFILRKTLDRFPPESLESKKAALAGVLPFIKNIVSPLERDYWLSELAVKTKVGKEVLLSELKLVKSDVVGSYYQPAVADSVGPELVLRAKQGEYVAALILRYPELKKCLREEELELFSQPEFAMVSAVLADENGSGRVISSAVEVASDLVAEWVTDPQEEFLKILKSLKRQRLQTRLKMIQADMARAEAAADNAGLAILSREFSELSKKLND